MAIHSRSGLDLARTLAYVRRYGMREHEVLKKCRLETLKNRKDDAAWMTPPEVATFVGFILNAMGAKKGVEVGVFTGYSSLAIALALPKDADLIACEVSQELGDIAQGYWKEAGVDKKWDLRIGDAKESLAKLLEKEKGSFDFTYIDADKESYDSYYESSLQLVRQGGLIIIDNTLWDGRVADRNDQEPTTVAIRELNEKLHRDDRVDLIQTAMGDGTTFLRKR